MSKIFETTQREHDSIASSPRARTWLRWVFPASTAPIAVEHGLAIGRADDCRARLDGNGVSRRHAELYRQGPIFAIRDLGSTNGTFLNGKRVQHAAINPGAILRVGVYVGVFESAPEEPAEFGEIAPGMFGGAALAEAFLPARRAAASDLPIVINGPTGTGKERVAVALHGLSGRKGPFQPLNCAALPKELAEAELFGYRKGAFTGADRASSGRFRAADGGTLFLDELAELPLELQAKLLRVVEERSVTPLGESDRHPVDVRLIVATQWPLKALVASKRFRADLATRLSAVSIDLPPLSQRSGDVASMFLHFVSRYSGGHSPEIESRLVEALCLYDWPGNVRELEQLVRRLLVVHGLEPRLRAAMLPHDLLAANSNNEADAGAIPAPPERKQHDRHRLALALRQSAGNVRAAAASVGLSRQRAYRLIDGATVSEFVAQELSCAAASDFESR